MTTNGWLSTRVAWRRRASIIMLLGPILLSSCAAAPFLIPVAFEFARNLFQTGLSNYGSKHRDNLSNLVNRLSSPYMQGLPPGAPGQPGFPGQPGMPPQQFPGQQPFPGQPGNFDPNNPAGVPTYPGGPASGFPPQTGLPPQQQYPGQQAFPGQPGAYDPNNPYGTAASAYPGATTYPGAAGGNPYGTAPGYPAQPGMNPYDQSNPYGAAAQNPYGQPANPYGGQPSYGSQNPYGGSGYSTQPGQPNPYGSAQPYGTPNPYGTQNPYGSTGYPAQPGQANAYGTPNPYGATPSPPPQAAYDPNNPYASGGQAQGYGQVQPYGQPQSSYGTPSPYGTQATQAQGYGGSQATGQPYGAQPYGGQAYGGPQPYGSAGIYPRSVGSDPVAVDVAMIRQKQTAQGKVVVLMNDGEVLKDGGANKEAGDKFKIVVRTNCDCYLYIMSIDGSGWAEPIYPIKDSKTANPVKKDQEYAFPEGAYWYSLDQIKGIESFFVVASANRRNDLEESFVQMAAETRPATTIVAKVEEPPIIPRGVGSVKPRGIIKVKDEAGETAQVTPLSYAASQPGQDVTVTRWFKHE